MVNQHPCFGQIKDSSAFCDFSKPYSASVEKTESDEPKISILNFFLEWLTPYTQADDGKGEEIEKNAKEIDEDEDIETDQVSNSDEPQVTNNAYENAPNNAQATTWVYLNLELWLHQVLFLVQQLSAWS